MLLSWQLWERVMEPYHPANSSAFSSKSHEEVFLRSVIPEKRFRLLVTQKGQINLSGSDAKKRYSAALFSSTFLEVPYRTRTILWVLVLFLLSHPQPFTSPVDTILTLLGFRWFICNFFQIVLTTVLIIHILFSHIIFSLHNHLVWVDITIIAIL